MLQYAKANPLSYAYGVIVVPYTTAEYDKTLTLRIRCGNATLAVAGDVTRRGAHAELPLFSWYACVEES